MALRSRSSRKVQTMAPSHGRRRTRSVALHCEALEDRLQLNATVPWSIVSPVSPGKDTGAAVWRIFGDRDSAHPNDVIVIDRNPNDLRLMLRATVNGEVVG